MIEALFIVMCVDAYTALQLVFPRALNASRDDGSFKYYYSKEHRADHPGAPVESTGTMDSDKTKTYDMARLEYAHLASLLFVDADEFLLCPEAGDTYADHRKYVQGAMHRIHAQGAQEMRFVVLPYGAFNTSNEQALATVSSCMEAGYTRRDLRQMFRCWSSASIYFQMPKSADLGSVCPFHYNHWSCDGMKGGGRDYMRWRAQCRCKVDFTMKNGLLSYEPRPDRCHIAHLNHFKFDFERRNFAKRRTTDFSGNLSEHCPLANIVQTKFSPAPHAGLGTRDE